jgi:vitamin K-dependent gamma-carboxylase
VIRTEPSIGLPLRGEGVTIRAVALSKWRHLEQLVVAPVDISFLVLLRVALGILLAVSMERFLAYGWVDELLLDPTFRFKYYGFHWVEPLPREQMFFLFRALVGLGLAVAAGFLFRVSALLLALGLTYIQLIDVSTYLNHYYLAALLAWLLALSPANSAASIDAWMRRIWSGKRGKKPPSPVSTVPSGFLWLFRFQIGLVYFCAGLAKLQTDWLIHGQPLRIWLGANTDLPIVGPLFTLPSVPLLISWLGFLFDISIVFWLSWSRARPYAYAVVLLFHTCTRLLFDIGMFPWIMSACALIFFPPDAARQWAGKVSKFWARLTRAAPRRGLCSLPLVAMSPPSPKRLRVALAVGLIYVSFQAVMPFRYLAYGDNVLWHEQGMRFSWRVMVRAKGGNVSFLVKTQEGEIFVDPGKYLTAFQENEMSGQPDLILQMAHHVGRQHQANLQAPVEVYANARVSLNGRRAAALIDPTVDLMALRDGLAPASYILPAPTQAPPQIRPVL